MTNKSEQTIERLNEVETRFARSPVWNSFVDGGLWRGDPPKSDSLSINADLTFYADGRR